jgi:hypothetical protein
MRKKQRHKKSERGATILESLICILLLTLLFFGLMQIFQWSMAKMLTEYSSFYTNKAYSLGYSYSIARRAARIAATGASGRDISNIPTVAPYSRENLSTAAEEYMNYGRYGPRGINFEYWEPDNITSDTPLVEISYPDENSQVIETRVRIRNMPLLTENLSWLLGTSEANPDGESRGFNYSSLYLENN